MAFKLQTMKFGVGIDPEATYGGTASTTFLRFSKLNAAMTSPTTAFESNQTETGKGGDFPTQNFSVSRTSSQSIERDGDSTFMIWALAYALGNVTVTGEAAPFTYTITPWDTVAQGIQLPSFSTVEQTTDAGTTATDYLWKGNVIDSLNISFSSGTGRSSVQTKVQYTGSGAYTDPSAITLPSLNADNYMIGGKMTLTILGTNYVTATSIVEGQFSYSNNLDAQNGYYPGSGADTSNFQQRGRLEVGTNRKAGFEFTVRLLSSSAEYTSLMALTTGTAVIGFTHDVGNLVTITLEKVQFNVVEFGQTEGTATVKVTCELLADPTNGLVSITGKCGVGGIAQAAG